MSQYEPTLSRSTNPMRLTIDLFDPAQDASDNLLIQEWIRVKNNLLIAMHAQMEWFDGMDEDGYNIANQADQLRDTFYGETPYAPIIAALQDLETFAEHFDRCISAGPGCDHNEEDHKAMVHLYRRGLLK